MGRSGVGVCGLLLAVGCVDRGYGPCLGGNELVEDARVDTSTGVPVFDWDLGTAYAVSVDEVDADGERIGATMWHVQCGGDNLTEDRRLEEQVCLRTPLAYGEEVTSEFLDTVNSTRARRLEPGRTYRVSLNTLVEDDGPRPVPDNAVLAEMQSWTPDREDPRCGSGFTAELDFTAP